MLPINTRNNNFLGIHVNPLSGAGHLVSQTGEDGPHMELRRDRESAFTRSSIYSSPSVGCKGRPVQLILDPCLSFCVDSDAIHGVTVKTCAHLPPNPPFHPHPPITRRHNTLISSSSSFPRKTCMVSTSDQISQPDILVHHDTCHPLSPPFLIPVPVFASHVPYFFSRCVW